MTGKKVMIDLNVIAIKDYADSEFLNFCIKNRNKIFTCGTIKDFYCSFYTNDQYTLKEDDNWVFGEDELIDVDDFIWSTSAHPQLFNLKNEDDE